MFHINATNKTGLEIGTALGNTIASQKLCLNRPSPGSLLKIQKRPNRRIWTDHRMPKHISGNLNKMSVSGRDRADSLLNWRFEK